MLKTGMIIAERYEIVSKIGTGGMADVYKAMDHKLNRFVAVKVLKPEFREDATFVKKFRSEAQAAAGLTCFFRWQSAYSCMIFLQNLPCCLSYQNALADGICQGTVL